MAVDDNDIQTKLRDLDNRIQMAGKTVHDLQMLRARFFNVQKKEDGTVKVDEQTDRSITTERRQTIYDQAVTDFNLLQ